MTIQTDKRGNRVLIIGSQGFIGQHVVREFETSSEGYEVYTCDIVNRVGSKRHSILDRSNLVLDNIFEARTFDFCVNCSGAASVGESNQNPRRDYELNVANVVKILDSMRRLNSSCRFLNLSSAAVYGNPESLPVSEDSGAAPISPYGLHKHQAEQLSLGYANFFGLRTSSVRIFSAYGPMLRKQLFWDLYKKALDSREIELWGTGKESRDFIEISDLSAAIRLVCEESEFAGEVINVACGQETLIEDAARVFFDNYDSGHVLNFNGQVKEGDPLNWRADISALSSMGFRPRVSIEQGLEKYVAWLKGLES